MKLCLRFPEGLFLIKQRFLPLFLFSSPWQPAPLFHSLSPSLLLSKVFFIHLRFPHPHRKQRVCCWKGVYRWAVEGKVSKSTLNAGWWTCEVPDHHPWVDALSPDALYSVQERGGSGSTLQSQSLWEGGREDWKAVRVCLCCFRDARDSGRPSLFSIYMFLSLIGDGHPSFR